MAMPTIGSMPRSGPDSKSEQESGNDRRDVEEAGRQGRNTKLAVRIEHTHCLGGKRYEQEETASSLASAVP